MIVVGIVIKNDQILIVKRKEREKDLLWQFPGGKIEENEHSEEAVIREIKEEVGIECKITCCLGSRIHPSTKKEIIYFMCEYLSGNIFLQQKEISDAIWIDKNHMMKYFTTPIYQPILDYLEISK